MAVKIRLMRIGANKRPFYRVVAVEEKKKRTGGYIELLGTYNPLTEPKEIILKQDRVNYWLEHGATPSNGYLRIIGKAPQKPARKPKKAVEPKAEAIKETPKKEATVAKEETAETPTTEEPATAEAQPENSEPTTETTEQPNQ